MNEPDAKVPVGGATEARTLPEFASETAALLETKGAPPAKAKKLVRAHKADVKRAWKHRQPPCAATDRILKEERDGMHGRRKGRLVRRDPSHSRSAATVYYRAPHSLYLYRYEVLPEHVETLRDRLSRGTVSPRHWFERSQKGWKFVPREQEPADAPGNPYEWDIVWHSTRTSRDTRSSIPPRSVQFQGHAKEIDIRSVFREPFSVTVRDPMKKKTHRKSSRDPRYELRPGAYFGTYTVVTVDEDGEIRSVPGYNNLSHESAELVVRRLRAGRHPSGRDPNSRSIKHSGGTRDRRYTFSREYTGHSSGRPQWVARFQNEWIGSSSTKGGAVKIAKEHQASRGMGTSRDVGSFALGAAAGAGALYAGQKLAERPKARAYARLGRMKARKAAKAGARHTGRHLTAWGERDPMNGPKSGRRPRSGGEFSQTMYEANEVARFRKELEAVKRPTKEEVAEWKEALGHDPELVAERIGWLLDGNYGFGSYHEAKKMVRSRGNAPAWLTQVVGALEWRVPFSKTRELWNGLNGTQKSRLAHEVDKAIKDHFENQ